VTHIRFEFISTVYGAIALIGPTGAIVCAIALFGWAKHLGGRGVRRATCLLFEQGPVMVAVMRNGAVSRECLAVALASDSRVEQNEDAPLPFLSVALLPGLPA
jgi:hypothetical protein